MKKLALLILFVTSSEIALGQQTDIQTQEFQILNPAENETTKIDLQEPELLEQLNRPQQWDISGYIKVVTKNPDNGRPSELEFDDLSVFISGNINQWFNPFVEAEVFSVPLWKSQGSSNIKDGHFIFERLYNDFNLSTDDRIRIGKFLAPVGHWNLIHAAPLVWSIERPISSTLSYSNYITGIEYGHAIDPLSGSRLDIYFQGTNDFDSKPKSSHPRGYSQIVGASWTLTDDLDTRSSLDIQFAKVRDNNTDRTTISWQKVWYLSQWDIDTQFIYTRVKGDEANKPEFFTGPAVKSDTNWDGGGYLQARFHINSHWNIYSRGERFHFAENDKSGNSYIIGARYKLDRLGNLNFEYRKGDGTKQIDGESFSISYNTMFRL